jgi:hypothetical protein
MVWNYLKIKQLLVGGGLDGIAKSWNVVRRNRVVH